MLTRCMETGSLPVVHLVRGWQMRGFDACRTSVPDGPMPRALALARSMERDMPGVLEISIQSGFALTDVWQVGPSVAVTGESVDPRFRALGERLIRFAWDERDNDTVPMISAADAVAQARAVPLGTGPIVLSDFGDAPGAGGYGDATAMLKLLLADSFPDSVFLSIAGAPSVQVAVAAGVGNSILLPLGGHRAPLQGGGPIEDVFEVLAVAGSVSW